MPNVDISREEAEALVVALRSYLNDFATEIHHTDDYDMKQQLQRRRELLNGFVQRLEGGA